MILKLPDSLELKGTESQVPNIDNGLLLTAERTLHPQNGIIPLHPLILAAHAPRAPNTRYFVGATHTLAVHDIHFVGVVIHTPAVHDARLVGVVIRTLRCVDAVIHTHSVLDSVTHTLAVLEMGRQLGMLRSAAQLSVPPLLRGCSLSETRKQRPGIWRC